METARYILSYRDAIAKEKNGKYENVPYVGECYDVRHRSLGDMRICGEMQWRCSDCLKYIADTRPMPNDRALSIAEQSLALLEEQMLRVQNSELTGYGESEEEFPVTAEAVSRCENGKLVCVSAEELVDSSCAGAGGSISSSDSVIVDQAIDC